MNADPDQSVLRLKDTCPKFQVTGVDGKHYTLDTFKEHKVLIVAFTCNHCPYVRAYEDRLNAIQVEFLDHGVRMVCINANDASQYSDDSFDLMVKRAKEKKFVFLYARDESQRVAKAFDAQCTPEVFVFDEDRALRYHGTIDDNIKDPRTVKRKYLRDAISSILHGREVVVPITHAIGCSIKWKVDSR